MDKKVTSIFAYIGIIFWLVAYLAGDKEGAKYHLNQGLVLSLVDIVVFMVLGIMGRFLAYIPVINWVFGFVSACIGAVILVFHIIGIVYACQDNEKPLPLIGEIQLIK